MNDIKPATPVKNGQIWNFKKFDPYIINQHGNTAKIDSITDESNDTAPRLVTFTIENGEQLCWEESILRAYAAPNEG